MSSALNSARWAAIMLGLCLWMAAPAHASLLWSWSYTGAGIAAGGTLTTTDTADAQGFFQITGITGTRNGQTITGLQPAGTAIPGNDGFPVDNLIRASGPQLTGNGFGFAITDGTFANPFFADFILPAGTLEFFSAPPFTSAIGTEDSELPVTFTATVPEPAGACLAAAMLVGLAVTRRSRRESRQTPNGSRSNV